MCVFISINKNLDDTIREEDLEEYKKQRKEDNKKSTEDDNNTTEDKPPTQQEIMKEYFKTINHPSKDNYEDFSIIFKNRSLNFKGVSDIDQLAIKK